MNNNKISIMTKAGLTLFIAAFLLPARAIAGDVTGNTGDTEKPSSTTVTLEECWDAAEKNYPLARQYGLISKSKDYTISNASRAYLPQVTFSAKASWQSDITRFKLDREQYNKTMFGSLIDPDDIEALLPKLRKDQYAASLDITQTIWDGGVLKAQKESAENEAEANAKSIDASLYGLRERINELYFGIMLLQHNIELSELMLGSLNANYDKLRAYKENGVIGQSDLDAIRIQILKTKQEALNLRNSKKAYIQMLSLLSGLELSENTELVQPREISVSGGEITRPELAMFNAQLKQIESQNRMLNAGLTPKFGLYVSGGYGRPGLNILSNSFKPYVVAGVKMIWNIGNFYNLKNNRQMLQLKMANIETQKSAFLLNTSIDESRRDTEIETLRSQLEYDDEIIELRKSVLKANEEKMYDGTISGTDYVGYLNDSLIAEQNKAQHEIKMLLAMYNLAYVRGK